MTACKAPDGSYWALQSWQRKLKNYGVPRPAARAAGSCTSRTGPARYPCSRSRWTRRLPRRPPLRQLHANGGGIYGFGATTAGVPLDSFGRNIYVDTFNSAYGSGWKRENSFLTHATGGTFCYLFARHGTRPIGNGSQYRATVIGPGVTPDVMWTGAAPPPGTAAEKAKTSAAIRALNDPTCRP